jgi:hypothetical protein
MSTRCNIIIHQSYEKYAILYHHHDGYPEGVGMELPKIVKNIDGAINMMNPTGLANAINKYDSNYEIEYGIQGDINYLYVINIDDGTLNCYSVDFFHNNIGIVEDLIAGNCNGQKLVFSEEVIKPKDDVEMDYNEYYYDLLNELKEVRNEIGELNNKVTDIINKFSK